MQENIHRNFGMPQPNGYRKALRFMRHADHFGFPILTFVDTPGAYAGKAAEEQGQASLCHPACALCTAVSTRGSRIRSHAPQIEGDSLAADGCWILLHVTDGKGVRESAASGGFEILQGGGPLG